MPLSSEIYFLPRCEGFRVGSNTLNTKGYVTTADSLQLRLVSCTESSCMVCVTARYSAGLCTSRGEEELNVYTSLNTS